MIGVIVDEIVNSPQHQTLFKTMNEWSETQDCYLFTSGVKQLPVENRFAIMQQLEALHHPGILISTSMLNTQILAHSLVATKKYYYVWHFEWMNLQQFGAQQLDKIFYHDEVELIARSMSHYNLLGQLFKPPKGIVYNWDRESLEKVVI
jgi:hypothetical protein